MTGVLLPRAASSVWLGLIAVLGVGCSAPVSPETVPGAGVYCVPPHNHVGGGDDWVPNDYPGRVEGFAFRGCWTVPATDRSSCFLPQNILHGSVVPSSANRASTWEQIRPSADVQSRLERPGAALEPNAQKGIWVLSDPAGWKDWWIWGDPDISKHLSAEEPPATAKLVSICSRSVDSAGVGGRDEYEFTCDRFSKGALYNLEYTVGRNDHLPTESELETLDGLVRSTIDSWKCERR